MSGPESWGMLVSSLGQWGDHVLFPYRHAIFHEKHFLWTYYYCDKIGISYLQHATLLLHLTNNPLIYWHSVFYFIYFVVLKNGNKILH